MYVYKFCYFVTGQEMEVGQLQAADVHRPARLADHQSEGGQVQADASQDLHQSGGHPRSGH